MPHARFRTLSLLTATATALTFAAPVATAQDAAFNGIVPNVISQSAPNASVKLEPVGVYSTGEFAASAAEIVAFQAESKRILTVNATSGEVDVLDASDPTNLTKIGSISAGEGKEINSVTVREDGLAVAAVQAPVKTDNGEALFFDATADTFTELGRVTIGAVPDNVSLSKDGKYALVANEGEPSNELNAEGTEYAVDPVGSVSVIALPDTVASPTQADVRTAGFEAFDAPGALSDGVRVFGPSGHHNLPSRDFEPEYVAPAANGKAYVSLQENNAIAIVAIESATVEKVVPAHVADHSVVPIDPSNKDGVAELRTLPVMGLSMPDTVAAFEAGGKTYFATANEGDAREWSIDEEDGGSGVYTDEVELADVIENNQVCDGALGDIDLQALAAKEVAGNLKLTNASGWNAEKECFDKLYAYGSRSFSIYDADGNVVFDSGADFERITAELHKQDVLNFNADNEDQEFDDRSDNKGPEPEALTVGQVGDRTYAFIGAERVGGIFVYDITNPAQATFQTYINNRDFSVDIDEDDLATTATAGDLGPEGFAFVSADDSPTGEYLLIVGNEVSGTTTVYTVTDLLSPSEVPPSSSTDGSSTDGSADGSSAAGGAAIAFAAVLGVLGAVGVGIANNKSLMSQILNLLPANISEQVSRILTGA